MRNWSIPNVNILNIFYYACNDDQIEARYNLDEALSKNYLEVTKVDTINNLIEGKFMATFLKDPKYKNPYYQDTLRFANGSFWAEIK